MSATPTEPQFDDTGEPDEFEGSPELEAMFRRTFSFGLAGGSLLLVETILPHVVPPGTLPRQVSWVLRVVGFGLIGATLFQGVAVLVELWRTRPRLAPAPREVLAPALEALQTSLLWWTLGGGVVGGWLQFWSVHRFGVERHSLTESLLGIALSTGGAYGGAWAWRVRARRQGVAAADIAEVQRTRS